MAWPLGGVDVEPGATCTGADAQQGRPDLGSFSSEPGGEHGLSDFNCINFHMPLKLLFSKRKERKKSSIILSGLVEVKCLYIHLCLTS